MATPGIGDPYWYEWYVGLTNVIEMINPDSNISYVILQAENYDVIDDVVVGYKDGKEEHCYQIKHEIGDINKSNLTFAKLIDNKKDKPSLLRTIAQGWEEAQTGNSEVNKRIPILYTNREYGTNNRKRVFNGESYTAYGLEHFYKELKKKLNEVESIEKIVFDDNDLDTQWHEFKEKILLSEEKMYDFLKDFLIFENSPNLEELEMEMKLKLIRYFNCPEGTADKLFNQLAAQLRIWSTTRRKNEKIMVEDVYETLSIGMDISRGNHDLYPPCPFFKSREEFSNNLINKLETSDSPVIFVSGEPGSGKTSIASYLYKVRNVFTLRFYAFRPISPEMRIYENDAGLCDIRSFWGDLLIQLREKFQGKLCQDSVPVVNELCSDIKLKKEVLRLSEILYKRNGTKVYICIDGIDHAARSKNNMTFLDDLPCPNEIPEGVCFVMFGQPPELYDKYPEWLKNSNELVEKYQMPKLKESDIEQLFRNVKSSWLFSENVSLNEIIRATMQKTNGNNLSVVFAVEEAKQCDTVESYYKILDNKHANGDVCKYYSYIWTHTAEMLKRQGIQISFPDVVIASSIVLMNGRIDTKLLSEGLSRIGLSLGDWDYIMNLLYPLIQPNGEHKYVIFHNDFRVYLTSKFSEQNCKYREVAKYLAEYLITSDNTFERAYNLIPLLLCAKKIEKVSEIFDTKFVIEYLAERLPLDKLEEYSKLAIKSAIISRKWERFYSVNLAIQSIWQHIKYYDYYEREYISSEIHENIDRSFIEEWKNKAISIENEKDFIRAIDIAKMLLRYDNKNGKQRAINILKLWFKDENPCTFIEKLKEAKNNSDSVWKDKLVSKVISEWGRLIASLDLENITLSVEFEKLNKDEKCALLTFNNSYLQYYFDDGYNEKSFRVLKEGIYSLKKIEKNMENILLNNSSIDLSNMYNFICENGSEDIKLLGLLGLMMSKEKLAIQEYEYIEKFSEQSFKVITEEIVYKLGLYTILYSIKASKDDIGVIFSKIKELYGDIEKSKNIMYLDDLVRFAIVIGKLIASEIFNSKIIVDQYYYEEIINKLTDNKNDVYSYNFDKTFKFFVSLALKYSKNINLDTINQCMKKLLFSKGISYDTKCNILDYFLSQDNFYVINSFINSIYTPDLYKQEEFAYIHNKLGKYGRIVNEKLMLKVDSKLKWDVVNYVGNKEYALDKPLFWYKNIVKSEPEEWKNRGRELLAQSNIADNYGNDLSYEINEGLGVAAAKCNFDDYWMFLNIDKNYNNLDLIYYTIFEFIDISNNYIELKNIWYFSIGILSWYNGRDRIAIRNIYNAIQKRLSVLNCESMEIIDSSLKLYEFIVNYYNLQINKFNNCQSTYKFRREDIKENISRMETEQIKKEVEILSVDNNSKWDYILYAIEIIEERGELDYYTALEFEKLIKKYCTNETWNMNNPIQLIIKKIVNIFNEDDIWGFAEIFSSYAIKEHGQYWYNIMGENMNLLLQEVAKKKEVSFSKKMFDLAINSNKQWSTGAGHIYDIESNIIVEESKLPIPQNFQQLALNILLIQCNSRNMHRIEISLLGIDYLIKNNEDLNDYLNDIWSMLSDLQKSCIYILFERWCQEDNRINKYIMLIEEEYKMANAADTKEQLYYIISNYNRKMNKECENIFFDINKSIKYQLPISNDLYKYFRMKSKEDKLAIKAESALNKIEELTSSSCNDLRQWLKENYIVENTSNQLIPKRDGDSILSETNEDREFMKVLYGEIAKKRWRNVNNLLMAKVLLNLDDAWVITTPPMPPIHQEKWDIEAILDKNNTNNNKIKSLFERIAKDGIDENQIVLGAQIYFPIGYDKSYVYTLTQKISQSSNFNCVNEIPYSLTEKSLLYFENQRNIKFGSNSEMYTTEHMGGLCGFINGNSMISPAYWLRSLLGWKPSDNNPLVWCKNNRIVMKNERFAYPIRQATSELYIRQPILSRWVCNKSELEEFLNSKSMRIIEVEELKEGEY